MNNSEAAAGRSLTELRLKNNDWGGSDNHSQFGKLVIPDTAGTKLTAAANCSLGWS